MPSAQVYVNWGRLVAECPCGDAREVEPGAPTMTCVSGHTSDLDWDAQLPGVLAALDERLSDKRRNWFPAGHPLALAGGFPHGQTPDDLRAETAAGEEADADAVADRRTALIGQLLELGAAPDIITEIRGMA